MSKYLRLHLVGLEEKLMLNKTSIYSYIFLSFYYIFQYSKCTSHRPISVADLSWSVNHIEPVTTSCLQNLCFLYFALGGGGPGGWSPPLGFANGPAARLSTLAVRVTECCKQIIDAVNTNLSLPFEVYRRYFLQLLPQTRVVRISTKIKFFLCYI
jgi:hypothetical protein